MRGLRAGLELRVREAGVRERIGEALGALVRGPLRVAEAAGRPRHDPLVAVVEVDLDLVLAFAHGADAARVHMAVLPRRHDADADGGLRHIVVGGADLAVLPRDALALVAVVELDGH